MHDSTLLATDDEMVLASKAATYGVALLSVEEEQRLFRAYAQSHDSAIRERVILANTRLAREIASKYHPRGGMTAEDIEQEALIGLMTAVERFDPERGFKFSTYATHWIRQRISRALADQAELIREPVHVQVRRSSARRQGEREPGRGKWRMVSLDAPVMNEFTSDSPDEATFAELIPAPESQVFEEHISQHDYWRSTLYQALAALSQRERYVLTLRFGLATGAEDCWTLEAIGKTMHVTRERVRQIERDALSELRRLLQPTAEGDAALRAIDDLRVARLARLREARQAQLADARAKRKPRTPAPLLAS